MAVDNWGSDPGFPAGKFYQVWSNSYYKIVIQASYVQHPKTNKTLLALICMILYDLDINDGHGMLNMDTTLGIGKTSISTGVNNSPDTITEVKEVSIGAGSSASTGTYNEGTEYIWDFTDLWYEFTHNSDGSVTNLSPIKFKWHSDIPVSSDKGVPLLDWRNVSASTFGIPAIDRSAPTGTLTAETVSKTSIGFTYTTNKNVNYIQYSINNGSSWTDIHTSGDITSKKYTITGLIPGTSYTVQVRSRNSYNDVWSDVSSDKSYFTRTTTSLAEPSIKTASVSNIKVNSATLNWSNTEKDELASIVRYEVTLNGGSSYIDAKTNSSYNITELKFNTFYNKQYGVRVVTTYKTITQTSATKYVSFTTVNPATPTAGTVTTSDITINSVKLTISNFKVDTVNSASINRYEITKDGGSTWSSIGNVSSYTVTGLSHSTAYGNKIGIRVVDNYGRYSTGVYVSFSTAIPKNPNSGTVTASNITINSVQLNWSGFSVAENSASITKYQITNDGGLTWIDVDKNTSSYTVTGLNPETTYTNKIGVRVVDSYNKVSSTVYVNVTTLIDQSRVWIRVNGQPKKGKAWIRIGGQPKKVKKVWIRVNGVPKLYKNIQ